MFELPPQFQAYYPGSGGGASLSSIKIQYCYDLLSASIISMQNKGGTETDQTADITHLEKNDLTIEDLGFFNIQRFKKIQDCGAYFLSRLRFGRLVFVKNEDGYEIFDLLKEEKTMMPGEIRQYQVYIEKKEKLPVRLILEKVPDDIAIKKERNSKQTNKINEEI